MKRLSQWLFLVGFLCTAWGVYGGWQKGIKGSNQAVALPPAAPALLPAPVAAPPPPPIVVRQPLRPAPQKPHQPKASKPIPLPKPVRPPKASIAPKPAPPKSPPPLPAKPAAPDYNPAILKNLPKPVAPPSDVELRQFVVEEAQWRGALSGIAKPLQVTFRQRDSFEQFWEQAISPYSKSYGHVPGVNFDNDMIVGVFLGEKPLPGYDIQILSAQRDTDGATPVLRIRYKEINRFLGIFATHFPVQPFHLLKVPAFSGRVLFEAVRDTK